MLEMFFQLEQRILKLRMFKTKRNAAVTAPPPYAPLAVAEKGHYNPRAHGLIDLNPEPGTHRDGDDDDLYDLYDSYDSYDPLSRFTRGTFPPSPRSPASIDTDFRVKHAYKPSYTSEQKPYAFFSVRVDESALADALEETPYSGAYSLPSAAGTKRKASSYGTYTPYSPPPTSAKRPRYELATTINPIDTDPNTQHHTVTNARRLPHKYPMGTSLARRAAGSLKGAFKSLWGRSSSRTYNSRSSSLDVPNPWAELSFEGSDTCFVNEKTGVL